MSKLQLNLYECPNCGHPHATKASLKKHQGSYECILATPEKNLRPSAKSADNSSSLRAFVPSCETPSHSGDPAEMVYSSDAPEYIPEDEPCTTLAVVPAPETALALPPSFSLDVIPAKDTPFWAIFQARFNDARDAMPKVVYFGAMMLWLESLMDRESNLDTRRNSRGQIDGSAQKDTGLKALLAECAPGVPRGTAYRFMNVAKAVQADFQMGKRLEKNVGFIALATSTPEQLPPEARAKQLELWDFVSGTHQTSWLDKLAAAKARGGDNTPRDENGKRIHKTPTESEIRDQHTREARDLCQELVTGEVFEKATWRFFDDTEIIGVATAMENHIATMRRWVKTPKRDRHNFTL